MSDLIDTVIETRKISTEIAVQSLASIDNISELKLHKAISDLMLSNKEIFPSGWYVPPPLGISVLFDEAPFERLLYDSLRNPKYFPDSEHTYTKESVGNIYLSPINKKNGIIGDIAFTTYNGSNNEIKQHLAKTYNVVLSIAEHVKVGMKFSELCEFATNTFKSNNLKHSTRLVVSSDSNQTLNIGHSIPGADGKEFVLGKTLEETIENVRTKRIHLINTENFEIPDTYAFTVESRLEDADNSEMPSASWHFMVCFDKGQKIIINGMEEIFKITGMDYMYK